MQRQLFDPAAYRIVLLDQRGAGKSTPAAETKVSELIDFIQVISKVKKKVEIKRLFISLTVHTFETNVKGKHDLALGGRHREAERTSRH